MRRRPGRGDNPPPRPESLDLDYLDERARITLAAGDPDEIVFALER